MINKEKNIFKIIISGGGTGGHIFPAISIGEAIRDACPNSEILYVGSIGKMEMEIVPKAGFKIKGIWMDGFARKLSIKNILFPLKFFISLIHSYFIIKKFKPNVVVGVGGYASAAILYVASLMKIPTLIQEQNSYPGITNRWLSKKVDLICVAYDNMDKYFPKEKIILTGNPLRKMFSNSNSIDKSEAYDYFGLSENKKTILFIGGSLGARSINNCVKENIDSFIKMDVQIIWQTGRGYQLVENINSEQVKIFDFINRMDYAYKISDIVISRAGAIAISELAANKKVTIFIPSPNVAEDHQTKNANYLVERGAALVIKDDSASKEIVDKIRFLLENEDEMKKLSDNISNFYIPNSAKIICDNVLKVSNYEYV